jgi:zinc resistance-associated protein
MKRLAVILGLVMLLAAFAYPAFARGPGWGGQGKQFCPGAGPGPGGGYGPGTGYSPRLGGGGFAGGWSNLTPEQMTQLEQLRQTHYNDTADLRNELRSKSYELRAVLVSPTTDPQKAQELQKQVSDLRTRMDERRLAFKLDAKKIAPEAAFGGGFGRGQGPRMGRGVGPGPCWN